MHTQLFPAPQSDARLFRGQGYRGMEGPSRYSTRTRQIETNSPSLSINRIRRKRAASEA